MIEYKVEVKWIIKSCLYFFVTFWIFELEKEMNFLYILPCYAFKVDLWQENSKENPVLV